MPTSSSQEQFGRNAQKYVTSEVHAKGWTLQRMRDLVQPQPDWRVLDVATGGGHTALRFAPHVASVLATDLTQEMLAVAEAFIAAKGITNVSFQRADACDLPFDDATFDCVTCRIAPHHFPDIFKFVRECARVVKPGGTVAIVDNIVPEGAAGDYINAFERLRDPSHGPNEMGGCISAEQWQQDAYAAGLTVTHVETGTMRMNFHKWTQRMSVSPDNVTRLEVMLRQAPAAAAASLTPEFDGVTIAFHLQRIVLIAQRD